MRALQALQQLAAKKVELPAALILHGTEEFLRTEVREALQRCLGEESDFVAFRPEAHERPGVALLDEVRTGSLFASEKLVWVEAAADFVQKESDALLAWVSDPGMGHLVLDDPALVTRRGKTVKKSKTVLALEEAGAWLVDCDPLFSSPYGYGKAPWDHELARWIVTRAESLEKTIEPPVAHLISSRVATGLRGIDSELRKLCVQIGSRSKISEKDVERAIVEGEESTIFELVDTFGARDRQAVLLAAHRLFDRGIRDEKGNRSFKSTEIVMRTLPLLARRLRELGRITEWVRGGADFDDAVASVLGRGRGWLGKKLRPQWSARDPRELGEAVVLLARLETDLKRSGGEARDLFMTFLLEATIDESRRQVVSQKGPFSVKGASS